MAAAPRASSSRAEASRTRKDVSPSRRTNSSALTLPSSATARKEARTIAEIMRPPAQNVSHHRLWHDEGRRESACLKFRKLRCEILAQPARAWDNKKIDWGTGQVGPACRVGPRHADCPRAGNEHRVRLLFVWEPAGGGRVHAQEDSLPALRRDVRGAVAERRGAERRAGRPG